MTAVCEQENTEVKTIRRTVKCPVCGKGNVIIASKNASFLNLRTYPPSMCKAAEYFVKCPKCGKQIGFTIRH